MTAASPSMPSAAVPTPRTGPQARAPQNAGTPCGTEPAAAAPLLEIEDLHVHFRTDQGLLPAVQGLHLRLAAGRTTCLVGESGCGKSLTAKAVLRLLPETPSNAAVSSWKARTLPPAPNANCAACVAAWWAWSFRSP